MTDFGVYMLICALGNVRLDGLLLDEWMKTPDAIVYCARQLEQARGRECYQPGDLNGDGAVGLPDFGVLKEHMGEQCANNGGQ